MHAPNLVDWVALKLLLRYLKGSLVHNLFILHSPINFLSIYNDVDWAGYLVDRRSTGDYLVYHGTNLIS